MNPMRSIALNALLLLLAALLIPTPSKAAIVEGRVVNQTFSRPETGCAVTLVRHKNGKADILRDTTDAEGRFRFEVSADTAGIQTFVSAHYAGVDYMHPAPENFGVPFDLPVYETTSVDTAISVISHHIVVDMQAGEVTQIVVVRNTGNRTFVKDGHGVEIPLPDNVTDLVEAMRGLRLEGRTVVDPRPVQPGEGQVVFVFRLPQSGRLVQPINYPTGAVDVLITPPGTPVSGGSLQDMGTAPFGKRTYRRFSGSGLNPGQAINLRIGSVADVGWKAWANRDVLKWVLGGLAVALAFLAFFFRPGQQQAPAPSGGGPEARKEALLEQIADLDDRFADGGIPEADYKARREALKAEVVELIRALEQGGA